MSLLDKEFAAFKYLLDFFPKVSAGKFKVFLVLQIKINEYKEFSQEIHRGRESSTEQF